MSEEYNPEVHVIEELERLEVELKEVVRQRDAATNPKDRRVLDEQVKEFQTQLEHLRAKLA